MKTTQYYLALILLAACSSPFDPAPEMQPVDVPMVPSYRVGSSSACSFPHHMSGTQCYQSLATALGVTTAYLINCAKLNAAGCLSGSAASAAAWWNWQQTEDSYGDRGAWGDPYCHRGQFMCDTFGNDDWWDQPDAGDDRWYLRR